MRYQTFYRTKTDDFWGSTYKQLVILVDGKEIAAHSDCGENEDNTFDRDWSWVKSALESAYALGVEHGRDNNA